MFSPLLNFQDEGYIDNYSTFWYAEKGKALEEYKILGVTTYDVKEITDGWDYMKVDFSDAVELQEWLHDGLKKCTHYASNPVPEDVNKIVILSTCQTIQVGGTKRCLIIGSKI